MNKYQEAYDYFYKIYDEQHLGMLARHYIDIIYEAIDKANKYDDKETPKKPVILGLSVAMHTCPVCDKELIITNDETVIYKTKTNYCDNCGQKLDWSNNDE